MSQTPLKLTMIGPSGTGKSCYLYATYFRMLEGVAGFNFNCVNINQARELEEAWNAILDDGVWPAGNAEGEEYRFACKHNGKPIGEFTWLDYRGGILNETESEGSDLAKFLNRAADSDAILVCLPTDVLLTAQANDLRAQRRWSRMKNEILRILGAVYQRNENASLVFMITKSDLCKSQEEGRRCVETIRTAFQQYFIGTPEYAMIAATRLGRFEGESDDFQQGAEIKGVLDPHNVHLPILLPFLTRARAAQAELTVAQTEYTLKAQEFDLASTQKERGEKMNSRGLKIILFTAAFFFLGLWLLNELGLFSETTFFVSLIVFFGGMTYGSLYGCKGVDLIVTAPEEYKLSEMRRELKVKECELQDVKQTVAIPTDAIWRELEGRVELYHNGKRVLSADGKARKA